MAVYHGWGRRSMLYERIDIRTKRNAQGGGFLSLDPCRHFPRLEFSGLLSLDPFWVSCNAAR